MKSFNIFPQFFLQIFPFLLFFLFYFFFSFFSFFFLLLLLAHSCIQSPTTRCRLSVPSLVAPNYRTTAGWLPPPRTMLTSLTWNCLHAIVVIAASATFGHQCTLVTARHCYFQPPLSAKPASSDTTTALPGFHHRPSWLPIPLSLLL